MANIQPALFVSHGAPTLALEDSPTHHFLRQLGQTLPRPRAIVVLSAHWQSSSVGVNQTTRPRTVHDFGGFPAPLYQLQYPAQTDAELAAHVLNMLQENGIAAAAQTGHGLDHGVWVPLMLMYPQADVPLVTVSLPYQADVAQLLALGRALRPLRDEGVLLVGSGSYTHNLGMMQPDGSQPAQWSMEFSDWLDSTLQQQNITAAKNWKTEAPNATLNHPSDEHLNPLWVMLGAASVDKVPQKLHEDWRFGNLSMACWRFD